MRRLERQLTQPLERVLAELPVSCDVGTRRNAKGHTESWIGYKLHIGAADSAVPVSCLLTSASLHDSQAAIALATMSARRVRSLYALMDSAYDCREIRAHDLSLGHKPIIDANPRRSAAMKEALKAENKARRTLGIVFPEDALYVERSTVERCRRAAQG